MRRQVPALIATLTLCMGLAAPIGADAAHWRWTVSAGEAHRGSEDRLVGSVTVANTGNARSRRVRGELRMQSGQSFERPAMPLVPPLAPGESVRLRFNPKAPRTYPHRLWTISFCVVQECRHLGRLAIGGRPSDEGSTAAG